MKKLSAQHCSKLWADKHAVHPVVNHPLTRIIDIIQRQIYVIFFLVLVTNLQGIKFVHMVRKWKIWIISEVGVLADNIHCHSELSSRLQNISCNFKLAFLLLLYPSSYMQHYRGWGLLCGTREAKWSQQRMFRGFPGR